MVAKGSHLSEEHKLKLSIARKGKDNYQTGRHHSEESKLKISLAFLGDKNPFYGKHHSAESLEKMRVPKLGKHPSKETLIKMSLAHSGENNPMFGKHLSAEAKRKIGEASKSENLSDETKRKQREAKLGKKLSEEAKTKVSNFNKGKILSLETRLKMSLHSLGELNPRWKGGITPEILRVRHCHEYNLWHQEVFRRDYWTCQMCGKKKGIKIIAHHIKSFKDYPELRFEVSNGITYCKDCHKNSKLHNKVLVA